MDSSCKLRPRSASLCRSPCDAMTSSPIAFTESCLQPDGYSTQRIGAQVATQMSREKNQVARGALADTLRATSQLADGIWLALHATPMLDHQLSINMQVRFDVRQHCYLSKRRQKLFLPSSVCYAETLPNLS